MHAFKAANVLALVIGALLSQGRVTQQMTVDPEHSSNTAVGAMSDQHVIPKVTPANCANSLGSNTCVQVKGGKCYCFVTQQQPWIKAFSYCQANKKSLLSVGTVKEQQELVANVLTLVSKDPVGSMIGVWTSGTFIPAMGVFYWAASSAYLTFANWLQGEPNGVDSDLCVRLVPSDWSWAALPCGQWLQFICES